MLQEYIPPAPGQDWFFHGYVDSGGRCAPAFTGVKDRSYPAYAGLTSLGRAVPNSRVAGQVTAMAAAIGFRGIVDLDLRFDPRDAQYKLLDFNPRLGAQFRLFTTGHRGRRGPGRVPRPHRPAGRGRGDDPGAAVPGRELRPARRGRLLAPRRAGAAVLGGVAARGGRGRLAGPR